MYNLLQNTKRFLFHILLQVQHFFSVFLFFVSIYIFKSFHLLKQTGQGSSDRESEANTCLKMCAQVCSLLCGLGTLEMQ